MDITEVLAALREPFHPSAISWKPGMVSKEKNKALALPYANMRAYQNRLDEILGIEWEVTYTTWGDKIVSHLTIAGTTRSSTGEPDEQSERAEIGGTSAEAQAFKRACAMFGLGRYIYGLPNTWVEYDAQTKKFTDSAQNRLDHMVTNHYNNYLRLRKEAEVKAAEALAKTPAKATKKAIAPVVVEDLPLVTEATPEPLTEAEVGITDAEREALATETSAAWKTPPDAWAWAVKQGLTENNFSAKTRWEEIVKEKYGRYQPSIFRAVACTYATHYLFEKEYA